ncbi:MAG: M6 family metalloprotease domain-containing protein [Myxococcota bacterium]
MTISLIHRLEKALLVLPCLLSITCWMGMSTPAEAAPAQPGTFWLEQPSGVRFEARQVGDEWCNRVEGLSGHPVVQAQDGGWYYQLGQVAGRPVLGERVQPGRTPNEAPLPLSCARPNQGPAFLPHAASKTSAEPFRGSVLFLLVDFADRKGTYDEVSFARFVKEEVRQYYYTVSYGAVDLQPAEESFGTANNGVVGWLRMSGNHPNTGSNTSSANAQLSKDAILAADRYVNFARYDLNADGYVDADELAVVVIAAGYERSYGMSSPSVWGHMWNLDAVAPPKVDGVIVGDSHNNKGGYCQFGEIHKAGPRDAGHQATVGIMVHELGHLIFRLPDLYDTDGSSNGAGGWCVMSYGSWGASTDDAFSGETPVAPGAYIRNSLGWSSAREGAGATTLTAVGASSGTASNTLVKIPTSVPEQFFLLENRSAVGYDRGLESTLGGAPSGIAIWHIDASIGTNRLDRRRLADVEEADGDTTAFKTTNLWYQGNGTRFDATSTPSSSLNNGTATNIRVGSFSMPGEQMSCTIEKP